MQEVIILGTGKSILDLTNAEKTYINEHPNTIGLNFFYLKQDEVNLKIKNLFIHDANPKRPDLVFSSIKKANKANSEITFFIQRKICELFYLGKIDFITPALNTLKLSIKTRTFPARPIRKKNITMVGFHSLIAHNHPELDFYWAKELWQPLYHYRGSLTTALNLVDIYFKPKKIKLLGIDMNTPLHFYDKSYNDLNARTDHHAKAYKMGLHATALANHQAPPIQTKLSVIFDHLSSKGVEVVCCSPSSLLVQEGICKYEPLV
jgi:hypothetical protein